MSADFYAWLTQPLSLAWMPQIGDDLRAHYRLIDAPLTRYLLGMARHIAELPALQTDWDWSLSWAENAAAGALPEKRLLNTGRLFLTLLIPLDLLLLYTIGKQLRGEMTGLIAMLLFGINALVLLHNRRAMAEAVLTSGILLYMWSLIRFPRQAGLAGLTLALAINAKQTAAALLPLGLLALAWNAFSQEDLPLIPRLFRVAWRWLVFLVVLSLVFLALNPVLWKHPVQAALAGWNERQQLMRKQLDDFNRLYPERSTESNSTRLAALIANLYLTPPAFAETSNYQSQTAPAEAAYLAGWGNNLLRGMVFGSAMLLFTLFGMVLAGMDLRRLPAWRYRAVVLLILATVLLAWGIFWLIPIPWQRYVMPLVPFVCLWVAYVPGRLLKPLP